MAEHGAHITSAGEGDRPTIFEVLAQESLLTTVRPALKHAIRVFAENRPVHFGWLLRYFDELYTCLDFLVENYYLYKYSGSFAENFYDLKRVVTGQHGGRLTSRHHWASLILLVLVPYVKVKLDQLFEDLRHKHGADSRLWGHTRMLTHVYLRCYPWVHFCWEGVSMLYQLTYLLGGGKYHSPFLHLSHTQLTHIDPSDLTSHTSASEETHSVSGVQRLRQLARRCLGAVSVTVSSGLTASMFFLQFLEWWHSSDNSHSKSLTALPIPHPPKSQNAQEVSAHVCPVCGRFITNDTALAVSGYVFCYRCIHGYVKQHNCCPVTQYPATQDHLIKLYLADM